MADSSFIAEALLKNKNLFEQEDSIISPDLALYELTNTVWKHQFLFKDVEDGSQYISFLGDLIESGSIILVRPDWLLLKSAYEIAGKKKLSIYDAIFLALAFETGLELRSLDGKMMDIFRKNR